MKIYKCKQLLEDSFIKNNMGDIDYFDSYMIKRHSNHSIEELKVKILTLPDWIKILLKIRHYLVVKPLGLNSGKQEVPIIYKSENEIVMGENDKHLYYSISINKKTNQQPEIYLTTTVKFNNNFGKVYFAFIKPFHILVVWSMLKKI